MALRAWSVRDLNAAETLQPGAAARWSAVAVCLMVLTTGAALCTQHWTGADYAVMRLVNGPAARWAVLDDAAYFLTRDMFSNLVLMAMVAYVWFQTQEVTYRAAILVGVLSSFVAGVLSRVLQLTLPTHLRPLYDPALHFVKPMFVDAKALNHWSSFPSDHAAIYYGLALTIFLANRRLGCFAFGFATLLNAVRVYRGFHYPTDIVSGAALGLLVVLATYDLRLWRPAIWLVAPKNEWKPLCYALCVYLCFGVGTMFIDYRDLASNLAHLVKAHGHPAVTNESNAPE